MRLLLTMLAVLCLTTTASAQQPYNGMVTSSGYTYRDGYFWYGNVPHTRSAYHTNGYWSCGIYYPSQSYWTYTAIANYQPAYSPPAAQVPAYTSDWKVQLLQNLKAQGDEKAYLDALKLLYPGGAPLPVQAMPYAGYGNLQGSYYSAQIPFNASTQFGYPLISFNQVAAYQNLNVDQAAQSFAQAVLLAQRLGGDAVSGFKEIIQTASDAQFKLQSQQAILDNNLKLSLAMLQNLQGTPTGTFKGVQFSIGPNGALKQSSGIADPAERAKAQTELAQVISVSCAKCHSGKTIKGGINLENYLEFDDATRRKVYQAIEQINPQTAMPRNDDNTVGKALDQNSKRLFYAVSK
jgi:mono/diheme cytochrome c family protein